MKGGGYFNICHFHDLLFSFLQIPIIIHIPTILLGTTRNILRIDLNIISKGPSIQPINRLRQPLNILQRILKCLEVPVDIIPCLHIDRFKEVRFIFPRLRHPSVVVLVEVKYVIEGVAAGLPPLAVRFLLLQQL